MTNKNLNLLPDPKAYSEGRLFCLDILRGLDMIYLVVIGTILPPLFKIYSASVSAHTSVFFTGHPWSWMSMWDMIMPLFIFMSGAAVPFALGRRLGPDGRPTAAYWKHVLSRFVLLWILGMLAQGGLSTYRWVHMSIYSNTLQTIAVGYLAAAIVFPLRKWWVKIAIPIVLLVVYTLLIHFGGGYAHKTNLAQRIDLAAWRMLFPPNADCIAYTEKYGYAWLLPSMMFPVLTLAGCYVTQILKSTALTQWKRAFAVLGIGAGALATGYVLTLIGIPPVKHIFASSFTLLAIGWSTLALGILYILTDIWKLRRGTGLILLFGQFALTAYLCESVFRSLTFALTGRLFHGLYCDIPGQWGVFVQGIFFSVTIVAILIVRRWLAIGRKA